MAKKTDVHAYIRDRFLALMLEFEEANDVAIARFKKSRAVASKESLDAIKQIVLIQSRIARKYKDYRDFEVEKLRKKYKR